MEDLRKFLKNLQEYVWEKSEHQLMIENIEFTNCFSKIKITNINDLF